MSDLIIPFNHQPTDNSSNSTSYTCPTGKYARVRIQVSGSAYGSPGYTSGITSAVATSDSFNESFEIWIIDGDEITFSATAASATTGAVTAGTAVGTSTVDVLFNGNSIALYKCSAVAGHVGASSTSTVSGVVSTRIYAEVYDEIT